MSVSLFPRLDPLCVEQCLASLDDLVRDAHLPLTDDRLPVGTGWSAIGGGQVPLSVLAELRTLLVGIAKDCGFPDGGGVAERARFDALATAALADFAPLASGEADRDDVWAFITTVLLPDLAAWRFANRSAERFEGGVRNTFQRLWMRAWALDRGNASGEDRWKLVETLTEDAMVQLTERPSIGADRRLSLAIANAWAGTAEKIGSARMQEIMRRAIIDLRIRNEIQMLSSLDDEGLQRHVDGMFARAAGLEVESDRRPVRQASSDGPAPSRVTAPDSPGSDDASSPGPAVHKPTGTSEQDIQHAILELMLDQQVWSNGQLKAKLARILPLTEADRAVGARPSEEVWENRVNNALGQARASSLYAKGHVENRGHGLHAITEKGIAHITNDVSLDRLLRDVGIEPPSRSSGSAAP